MHIFLAKVKVAINIPFSYDREESGFKIYSKMFPRPKKIEKIRDVVQVLPTRIEEYLLRKRGVTLNLNESWVSNK